MIVAMHCNKHTNKVSTTSPKRAMTYVSVAYKAGMVQVVRAAALAAVTTYAVKQRMNADATDASDAPAP
jgi:hypothetical protein